MIKVDSITAMKTIRDSLRTNLTDAYQYAGGTARLGSTWIYYDEPHVSGKYPQIEIKKVDNPSTVLSIGPSYGEREFVFMNIWFYIKNGFKLIISGTEYKNTEAVEYYLGLIKRTLKAQNSTLFTAGVKGYSHLNTTKVEYDPATQLYYAAATVRVEFFINCG